MLRLAGSINIGGAYFGEGIGLIHFSEIDCSGAESNLTECAYTMNEEEICTHASDSSVICQGVISIVCVYLISQRHVDYITHPVYSKNIHFYFYLCLQFQMHHVSMARSVSLSQAGLRTQGGWRCALGGSGGRCAMTLGRTPTLKLCAGSLASQLTVCARTCVLVHVCVCVCACTIESNQAK